MRTNQPLGIALKKAALCVLISCVAMLSSYRVYAQASKAPQNMDTALVNNGPNGFTNISVASSAGGFSATRNNIIDNDLTNAATWSYLATLGSTEWIEVKDNSATGAQVFPAGSYAGFVIGSGALLDLNSSIKIETFLGNGGNSLQETYDAPNGILSVSLLGNDRGKVGFVTTKSFDRVRISFTVVGVAGSRSVYYAQILKPQTAALTAPPCNTTTSLVQSAYPVTVTTGTTGIATVSLLGGIFSNVDNVVDASTANAATITLPVGALSTAFLSVKEAGDPAVLFHPAGYFAGFEVSNGSLLGLGLLSNSTISTYLNGQLRETKSGSGLLLSAPLLSSNGRSTIGFATTMSFNEIRYTITQPLNVNLGTTSIYAAVVKRFCESPALVCNTLTELNSKGTDPVYINMANTGVSGAVAVNNNITDLDKLIDGDPNTAAVIKAPASVSVLSTPHVSVKKALQPYVAGTYVAFDVETESLLYANVLATAKVRLYLNGQEKQSSTGSALLVGTKSTLLSGSGSKTRQYMGIVANTSFDEVVLEFNQPVGATLGDVSIYGIKVQKNCSGVLECNATNIITNSSTGFGAVINNERSGVSGAICASCNINNINSVVTPNAATPAKMFITAGVIANAAISVQVPANTFTKGTIAGFLIRTNNATLVGLDLLKYLKIETFYNGVLAEEGTAGQLLGLDLITLPIIGSRTGMYNVGIKTTLPYNEIRISTTNIVGANVIGDKDIDVFYATVDTRYLSASEATGIGCSIFKTNPDINYTTINKPVNGNVKTNDVVPTGTTYANPVAGVGANGQATPGTGTFSNWNGAVGTYTFTATAPGVYSYNVKVCSGANNCRLENLTITVTDPTKTDNSNPPIVNTDIAITKVGAPVIVNVLFNDHAGNKNGGLGNPDVDKQGLHGTAAFAAPNVIKYTPDAGFVGRDTVVYKTQETPSNKTGFAYIIIDAVPADASATSAADDFTMTDVGTEVNGTVNVKDNDVDPAGLPQTVTAYTLEDTQGKFVLGSDGKFVYTPAAGYTGTAQYTYETKNSAGATANATVYVAVAAATDLVPRVKLNPVNIIGASDVEVTVELYEIANVASVGPITIYVDKLSIFGDATFDQTGTKNAAGETLQNSQFTVDATSNPDAYVITTNASLKDSDLRLMFKVKANPGATAGVGTLNVLLKNGSGGDSNAANNTSSTNITYSFIPQP
ncbi:Ig-like domain-containing protein [Niabella sp.]|uniref:Ig-like domain-containing protein n=1 Tax=Niabella sp. TaxID=1962976 RepID=UPI0026051791|nr:Ig-like domain-containing protein [Niabella sp.]